MKSPLLHRLAAGGICLQKTYCINLHDKPVGEAHMTPQGLYYNISCICDLDKNQIYEVILCGKDIKQNLGILAPENGRFTLVKKIPAKRLIDSEVSFCVVKRSKQDVYDFISVYEGSPFVYIDRLQDAFLSRKDGAVGICIPRSQSVDF